MEIKSSNDLSEISNNGLCQVAVKNIVGSVIDETHRTEFRRQRDRILYSGGFRRLQDKTQVISSTKSGDHRTRLTHTLEVEQIATSVSDALMLNRDLAAAIAFGHDIGHTPFGHAAERVLDELLKENGGFSHAVQSVRFIKNRQIKISNIVLEGILKHDTDIFKKGVKNEQYDCSFLHPEKLGYLEAQVVYWADKLAYLSHDFEDFYCNGFYDELLKNDSNVTSKLASLLSEITDKKNISSDIKNFHTRDFIRSLLSDLIKNSASNIQKLITENPNADFNYCVEKSTKMYESEKEKKSENAFLKSLIINMSDEKRNAYIELRKLLNEHYIGSPEVSLSDAKAEKIIKSLFEEFTRNFNLLPLEIRKLIVEDNIVEKSKVYNYRVVADYICSMTDSYAEKVYFNLNFPNRNYNY